VLVALALAALCAFPLPALGDTATGTCTLSFGEHLDVHVDFDEGTSIDIAYEVTVTEGPPVNVYFVDSDGREDYLDPAATGFSCFKAWSSTGTTHAREEFTIDTHGDYYVIIENTAASLDNATVEYTVSHGPTPWWRLAVFWAVAVAVLAGVPVAIVLLRWRQARGPPEAPPARPLG
jgi:hypothetical protein